MNPALVRDVVKEAIQAFLAIPKRGIETGGLLFGQVRREHDTEVFEIAAFEEIPSEHRFGPSYVLDKQDRGRLAEVLAQRERDGSSPVVGFYRSYTGRDAALDDADLELMRTFFPRHKLACLLLRPVSMRECHTSLQFWDSGTVEAEAEPEPAPSPMEAAPLSAEPAPPPSADRARILPLERARPLPAAHVPFAFETARAGVRRAAREYEDPPPRDTRLTRILAVLCCLLFAIAALATYELWYATRVPREARIRFEAQPAAGDLLLRWDAANPAVKAATRGTLAIIDGGYPFEIKLSGEQVRSGNIRFAPTSGDSAFRIRLYDNQREVAEDSVRVIRNPVPPPVVASVPARASAAASAPAGASAPVARREVQPVISPGIRARIAAPTKVPVMVSVDTSGHVTKAWSKMAGHDGLERYLITAATGAAREWSFSPARSKNGEPVAATTTISFAFEPAR